MLSLTHHFQGARFGVGGGGEEGEESIESDSTHFTGNVSLSRARGLENPRDSTRDGGCWQG
jgi:hypothetical protein